MATIDVTCIEPDCTHVIHVHGSNGHTKTALGKVTMTHEDSYHDVHDLPVGATLTSSERDT